MQVTLKSDSVGARQLLLEDPYTGEWGKNNFLWQGLYHLSWGDKRLAYCLTSRSKVDEESAHDDWTVRLLDAAVKAAGDSRLSAFSDNDLTHKIEKKPPIKNEPQTVTVGDGFGKKLEEEHALFQQARKSFEYAVGRVKSGVSCLPHGGSSEIGQWLHFLERMLECGYLGFQHGWYREKMSGIRSYVSDLARRKNRNHHGFRFGFEYINSNLSCFSPPAAWCERPPLVSSAELMHVA